MADLEETQVQVVTMLPSLVVTLWRDADTHRPTQKVSKDFLDPWP